MSILSDFEDRVAGAVEGLFAGAFRSPVQPAEIAKALARSMDDGRAVGVGKVYAPVGYKVRLSREDHEKMGAFKDTLARELEVFLADHARKKSYHLASPPKVELESRRGLKLGRFEVGSELARAEEMLGEDRDEKPERKPAAPAARLAPLPPGLSTVTVGETHHDVALRGEKITVGRLAECDIVLPDANVSRRHSEFVRDQGGWVIQDLDSTNGTHVNGQKVARVRLKDGDTIAIGASRLVFHEPRG